MGFNTENSYINIAREIEKQLGCKIYIVGGFVRDKIIGLESVDLDFVAEGAGIPASELFHKKLDGQLTVYKKFLTASLKLKNGFVIDIATARTEIYPKPASMPVVVPAGIKDDLYRRDFTINALAIPLPTFLKGNQSDRFQLPTIIDVCGGLDDIKNKKIRVIHKKSFIDDPTRILRAIRYACRFGFGIEKDTERRMADAIEKGLLSLVSAPRLRDEFIKTLEEKNAKKILLEFKKRKILKYFDDALDIRSISKKEEPVKNRLRKLLKNFKEKEKILFLKKLCLPVKI